VATILCIFPLILFLLPPLFKTTEGVVLGFEMCAWAPRGDFFKKFFFENIRRRSVRVLKLHRGSILTKKEDINPPPTGASGIVDF
jgi:hypothetical protein